MGRNLIRPSLWSQKQRVIKNGGLEPDFRMSDWKYSTWGLLPHIHHRIKFYLSVMDGSDILDARAIMNHIRFCCICLKKWLQKQDFFCLVHNLWASLTSEGNGARYQVVAGVLEQRLLEPMLHNQKLLLSALCFAVRTGNTFLGSLLYVTFPLCMILLFAWQHFLSPFICMGSLFFVLSKGCIPMVLNINGGYIMGCTSLKPWWYWVNMCISQLV